MTDITAAHMMVAFPAGNFFNALPAQNIKAASATGNRMSSIRT